MEETKSSAKLDETLTNLISVGQTIHTLIAIYNAPSGLLLLFNEAQSLRFALLVLQTSLQQISSPEVYQRYVDGLQTELEDAQDVVAVLKSQVEEQLNRVEDVPGETRWKRLEHDWQVVKPLVKKVTIRVRQCRMVIERRTSMIDMTNWSVHILSLLSGLAEKTLTMV